MSTQLLINGQIQTFNQPVSSWQPIPQNQVQINWGGGDIETISGTSATKSQVAQNIPFVRYRGGCQIYDRFNGAYLGELPIQFISTQFPSNFRIWHCGVGTEARVSVDITALRPTGLEYFCGQPWSVYYPDTPLTLSYAYGRFTFRSTSSSRTHRDNHSYRFLEFWSEGSGTYADVVKTVVLSNTGAMSERWGNLNPQITTITSSCILRVTFENGTTQDLNYPTCPTVAWAFNCPSACTIADRIITLLGD